MSDTSSSETAAGRPKAASLSSQALGNFMWMFGGGGIAAVLRIAVLVVLARLLSPSDFGLVSAALTVVALAVVFGRIGVAPAIIQTVELTEAHIRTAISSTLVLGTTVAALVFLLAKQIAALYAMPDLVPLVRAFSVLFLLYGLGMVSGALIERRMQFRELAMIRLTSYVFGYALVAIVLARLGFGAWALVIGQLAQVSIETTCFLIIARAGLRPGFDWPVFRRMIRFGFGVTLTQLGNYAARNVDYFVVGRMLGTAPLGHYSRAYVLLTQPSQLVGSMGDKVLFPAMASVQGDKARMARAVNSALALCAMVQVPLSVLLIIAGPELILVLMGPQWSETILPFQILIAALYFRTAYKFVNTLMRSSGSVYLSALWQWTYAVFVAIGAFGGVAWGLLGVAAGVSLAVAACFGLGLFLAHSRMRVSTAPGLRALARHTALALGLAIGLVGLKSWLVGLGTSSLLTLLTLSGATLVVYLGLLFGLPRLFGAEGAMLVDHALRRARRRRAAPVPD